MADEPVATVRTALDAECQVLASCRDCEHDRQLDLADLAAKGHAETPLLSLPPTT